MAGISEIVRKIVDELKIERIALSVSFFYCLGVVLLLQHNAICNGDIDFDFVRVKPIIVGLEYVIYLALPILAVLLPCCFVSSACYCDIERSFVSRFGRACWLVRGVTICIRWGIVLALSYEFFYWFGVMFHYFIPYTEYHFFDATTVTSLKDISYAFWMMYLHVDLHLVAFGLLYCATFLLFARQRNVIKIAAPAHRTIFNTVVVLFCAVAFFLNMFYFERDVYMNISQAAAGGAPISGIITIVNPSMQARKGMDGVVRASEEVTKFCSIMQSDASYLYIDDQLIGDRGAIGGRCRKYRHNSTRIRKEDVKQFTPILLPSRYYCGRCIGYGLPAQYELVHNVSLFVEFLLSAESETVAEKLPHYFNVTNRVVAIWLGDNIPRCELPISYQRIVKEDSTNLCYTVEFNDVPIPAGTSIPELMDCITNAYAGCQLVDLPVLPKGVKARRLAAGFAVNYFLTVCWYDSLFESYGSVITITRKKPKAVQQNGTRDLDKIRPIYPWIDGADRRSEKMGLNKFSPSDALGQKWIGGTPFRESIKSYNSVR